MVSFVTSKKIKKTFSDLAFDITNYTLLGVFALIVLYPLYIILIASISDPYAVIRGEVALFPKDISFIGYGKLLNNNQIWVSYRNTVIYTLFGTSLNIIVTMMAGYALSRNFKGKKAVNIYFVFTMFFGGGLIPTFLIVKAYGLYNNPLVFILLGAISVWNVMIARSFIQFSLPSELYEAAVIDGCSHFRHFGKIVLPLSKSLMAVLVVYYGVGHWNNFMTGLIYISNRQYMPLQVILRELLASLKVSGEMADMVSDMMNMDEIIRTAETVKYCSILISSLPVIILYMFMQKYFVKGVMLGSLKG